MKNTPQIKKFTTLKSVFSHLIEVKKAKYTIWWLLLLYISMIVSEPYFYKILVDRLEVELKNPTWHIPDIMLITIGIWIGITILSILARYIFAKTLLTLQNRDWQNFLLKGMQKMLLLPIDYHIGIQHGEKQKIIDRGAEAVWQAWDIIILRIIPQITIAVCLIIFWFIIDWKMTVLSLIFLPISIYFIFHIGKSAHTNQRTANKYWDKVFWRISDSFTNLQIMRIFDRNDYEVAILSERIDHASREQNKVRKLWILFNSFGWAFVFVAKVLILSIGIILIYKWQLSLWTLLFFLAFADRVYGPIFSVFEWYQNMMINIAHYEKIESIFTMENEQDTGNKELTKLENNITFDWVSFIYPWTKRSVLSNIQMTIKKWERIALIGQTGSGKSTIVQLLMRFYKPTQWTILMNNGDIYWYTLDSFRQKFAAVFQDTTLFNETIQHNLEYVRDNITQQDIEEACKKANILEFIESLPEKWETEVGERWLKLSGGEKQRIAIARAILANPEILILDEATSALDTKTEKLIQNAFDNLMEWRTSIIIAHRLSTIINADTIYLLDKGKIVAQWSHDILYKESPEYKEMVDLQHDWFVKE